MIPATILPHPIPLGSNVRPTIRPPAQFIRHHRPATRYLIYSPRVCRASRIRVFRFTVTENAPSGFTPMSGAAGSGTVDDPERH